MTPNKPPFVVAPQAQCEVRIPCPGITAHYAFNCVYPALSFAEAGRFASLASRVTLAPAEWEEMVGLCEKSKVCIPVTGTTRSTTDAQVASFAEYVKIMRDTHGLSVRRSTS